MFRGQRQPAIGLAIAMRDGGDILAMGRNIEAQMADLRRSANGLQADLVADQPSSSTRDHRLTNSLWQAIPIVLAVSFLASVCVPERRGITIPLAGNRLRGDGLVNIDLPASHSARSSLR